MGTSALEQLTMPQMAQIARLVDDNLLEVKPKSYLLVECKTYPNRSRKDVV
jgi:hypothetical protein